MYDICIIFFRGVGLPPTSCGCRKTPDADRSIDELAGNVATQNDRISIALVKAEHISYIWGLFKWGII